MIIDDFHSQLIQKAYKAKPAKKEYSAGFKKHRPPTSKPSTETDIDHQEDIFQQLKIGNLKELYLQSLPPPQDQSKIRAQEQVRAVARLVTKTVKGSEIVVDDQEEMVRKADQELQFMATYHQVQNFKQKATRVLFRNEVDKIKQKLLQISRKYSKAIPFEASLLPFLIFKSKSYTQKLKISNEELLLDFTNYLNTRMISSNSTVRLSTFQQIIKKNTFLYSYFSDSNTTDNVLDAQGIKKLVRKEDEDEMNWEFIEELMQKKITVPYETALFKTYQNVSEVPPQKQNLQQEKDDNKKIFKANPIPKTTYQKPQTRPKSQTSKLKTQPFNLTVTNAVMPTLQQVYKWNRNFQASQIPKTTYRPNTIKLSDEDEKKARALELLHSAQYPSTMQYLQKYQDIRQQKTQELQHKYTKIRTAEVQRGVPNFEVIHQRQVKDLEKAQIENRTLTKSKPFNLSQNRPAKQHYIPPPAEIIEETLQRKVKRNTSQPKFQPHSTLKFDTYVKHLKQQKQQKLEKEEQKKKEKTKRQQKQRQFKQLLKDRVDCELGRTPKVPFNPPPLPSSSIKVNLQKIYNQQPLLIERETVKSKKYAQAQKKNWQPII